MCRVAGDEASLIAKTDNMEAIEDVHYAVGIVVAESIVSGDPVTRTQARFVEDLAKDLTADTLDSLAVLAAEIVQTMYSEGTLFVLGTGIGSCHFRADAGRGFTNCLPIRGVFAPEFFSVNSAMATANDDGPQFILADGLAKMRVDCERDLAILMTLGMPDGNYAPVEELLGDVKIFRVGSATEPLRFSNLLRHDKEFVASLVGHSMGYTIREVMWQEWGVRPLPASLLDGVSLRGQRKPSFSDTVALETDLRSRGVLSQAEVLTFAYGTPYAAVSPESRGMRRVHY
jgi:hypothetical protein